METERNSFEGWEISLQRELILESGIDKIEWIEKYSPKYREIIESHPQFIEEYKTDKSELKEQIKNLLYEETIH